jgi:hypothetical protein
MIKEKASILALAGYLLATIFSFVPQAQACFDLTVRDAAFQEPRDMHLLGVMAAADDPAGEEIFLRLEQWLNGSGENLNIELYRVDIGSPDTPWGDYGIPSAPPELPVVVLAGKGSASLRRPNFVVDHWEPGPTGQDLEVLKSSPAREKIRGEVGHRLAVLVYVPGNDNPDNSAEDAIESVVRTWLEREPLGVSVVRVNRSDERERLLLSFMGVRRTGPDWVGVVFGQGKLMPPLRGEEITEGNLNALLETLVGECSCLQSPTALGIDLPMDWDEACDESVVALRSSDIVVGSVAGSWGILATTLWTLGGLAVLVGLATAWIMRSKKREV